MAVFTNSFVRRLIPAVATAVTFSACGNAGIEKKTGEDNNGGAENNGGANNGGVNNGGANNGGVNNGGANNGAVNNGAVNNGAVNNGAVNNGAVNNGAVNNGAVNNGIVVVTEVRVDHDGVLSRGENEQLCALFASCSPDEFAESYVSLEDCVDEFVYQSTQLIEDYEAAGGSLCGDLMSRWLECRVDGAYCVDGSAKTDEDVVAACEREYREALETECSPE